LASFYEIHGQTAAACSIIDAVSTFLPFALLRPLNAAHSAAGNVPNKELIVDKTVQASTTLLAAAIYHVALFVAYQTYLPTTLVLYFEHLPSVEPAHQAANSLWMGGPAALLSLYSGVAARSFIFTPVTATPRSKEDAEIERFDPVRATLGETARVNLWGFKGRTKVALKRTALVILATVINTTVQLSTTIGGVEAYGALVYSSVWVVAALFTGLAMTAVGEE